METQCAEGTLVKVKHFREKMGLLGKNEYVKGTLW